MKPGQEEIQAPIHISSSERSGLPDRLLQDTPRRLGFVALIYAGCYLIAFLASRLSGTFEAFGTSAILANSLATISILISLGVYALSRTNWLTLSAFSDLGLFYQVLGAAGIDFYLTWISIDASFLPIGISWVGVWIICFVAIVPSTPGKTLLTALLSASVTPLLLLVGMARGTADPSTAAMVQLSLPNYLCALIAFAGSRVIYQLRTEVAGAQQLGRYRLVKQLGHGGMGEVWKASHGMLARPAAIKLISPETLGSGSPDAEALFKRFQREAKATANLRSVHTVTIYDYGVSDGGSFYYVMELLEGLDLSALVHRFGPLSAPRVIYLLKQVCHSLVEAHQKGFIHRDIKPGNLFVCRLGPDFDFVKVLDFGLVKNQEQGEQDTALTQLGVATGTPGYMSPEMILGNEEIDGRADIYALGCVAYWMLTGQTVFEAETPMEIFMKHMKEDPVNPSQIAEIKIPSELDDLVLRCLKKSRTDRPQTIQEVQKRLAGVQVAGWDQVQAREWWNSHLPGAVA